MEELWKSGVEGWFPVLVEIYNPDLKWSDSSLEQDDMYLRVISDTNAVIYKGKKYLPCRFTYTPPEKDGKQVGQASITISALDSRIIQMLRSVEIQCEITVVAGFVKNGSVYKFIPLDTFKGTVASASYNSTTAQLDLTYKDVLALNIPKDTMTKDMLPSVSENV